MTLPTAFGVCGLSFLPQSHGFSFILSPQSSPHEAYKEAKQQLQNHKFKSKNEGLRGIVVIQNLGIRYLVVEMFDDTMQNIINTLRITTQL